MLWQTILKGCSIGLKWTGPYSKAMVGVDPDRVRHGNPEIVNLDKVYLQLDYVFVISKGPLKPSCAAILHNNSLTLSHFRLFMLFS